MKDRKAMNMQHGYRAVALILLAAVFSGSCTGSDSTGDSSPASAPVTYRVSTQADFDALGPLVLNGGDQILFERGRSFWGALSLKRSEVRPDQVIRIADFGSPEAPRPVISADAHGTGAIDIRDSGGWTIENLEISNRAAVRSERMGIFVTATDSGTHKNFVVRNNYIHDVTGEFKNFNNGGIVFRVTGESVPTKFDGVLIENNEIRNISGVGIRTKSTWESGPDDPRGLSRYLIGRHAHLNVVVRGNRVSDVTRNAIIVGSADGPLLEYNVMGPNIATETTGNTLYTYATDNALVQYNEAFGNHGPATDIDHGGFDADYASRNTEFRYNYSHDNNFAFAIMRKYLNGTRIHHNISVNERYGFIHYGFGDAHAITDLVISNNTFYSSNPDMNMFMNFNGEREAIDTTLIDNIFVFAGEGAGWGSVPTADRGMVFENNIVVGLEDPDYIELTADPLFVAPGAGGTEINMTDPDRLGDYRLCRGSPAIGTGREGDNAARADFWGNEIDSENIGAYGGAGVDCTQNTGGVQPMHIFLLAGQSNMAGRGELTELDRTPHPRVFALNKNDEWVIATEPIHFDKPKIRGTGPGLAFAKEIANRNPGIRVGLIPTAVGGSGIETWTPGGYHEQTNTHPWDDAVHRLGVAMKSGELKAILWHQGESDSRPGRANLYETRLHGLIRRFRDLANDDRLPFIIGQLGQFKEWTDGRQLVNAAHEAVPSHFERTRFVSSDGLNHIGDKTHFDALSARELGRRYADAYADILLTTPP
jgi:hypothetical protein